MLTWARTASRDAGLAGSAGMRCSTRRVSTAMQPMGTPPSLPRPTTTDLPQSARYSVNEPCSALGSGLGLGLGLGLGANPNP